MNPNDLFITAKCTITLGINGKIAVLKNRYETELPWTEVHFEKETGLLLEIQKETSEIFGYTFRWDTDIPKDFTEVQVGIPWDD
ncbi:hypothetical protein Amet_0961 [Alkaliphilus metalliredigens QYMF]|uniref:Uncharacterized protein n=1 Tax=Alkaliphilus metalliredigens (strain QYMF) TaxID=293826 RepID=A6TLW1_ALKMQ|nr:hypothetical protein [Alkaliphilus metalliredigens]ABR47179.1 hypothetical protein Amet_0961 [Alkaliphilus metalliredigens QYMF]